MQGGWIRGWSTWAACIHWAPLASCQHWAFYTLLLCLGPPSLAPTVNLKEKTHFKEAGAEGMQNSRGLKWLQDFDSRCLVKGGINGSLHIVSPRYLILRISSLWRKLLLVFSTAKRLLGHLCIVISLKSCLSVFGLTSRCLICSSVKHYLLRTLKYEGNAVTLLFFPGISCVLVIALFFRSEIHSLSRQHTWKTNCAISSLLLLSLNYK